MSDVHSYSRQFITEFIELYKSLPCLWKKKSRDYNSRALKSISYKKMVEKLKEVDPNATRELVVKKINSLRTSRRKEWKRIREATQSGCVHKPLLWYFDILSFTDDQEVAQVTSNTDHQPQQSATVEACIERVKVEIVDNIFSSQDNASETNSRTSRISNEYQNAEHDYANTSASTAAQNQRPPKRKLNSSDHPNDRHVEDRYEIFGKSVAIKMRDLATQQRLIAEKIINDTLFKAEMGTLKLSDALGCKASNE